MLPLSILVVALSAAAVWFVGLPALEAPPPKRSCEVVFLETGSTKCVERPTRATLVAKKTRPAARPKR